MIKLIIKEIMLWVTTLSTATWVCTVDSLPVNILVIWGVVNIIMITVMVKTTTYEEFKEISGYNLICDDDNEDE